MRSRRYPYGLISIDGGLHIGVSVWNGNNHPSVEEIKLTGDEVCASRPDRVHILAWKFDRLLNVLFDKIEITEGVIEDVGLWWGKVPIIRHPSMGPCFAVPVKSRYSMSIIAARKGNTFFTAYIVGALIYVMRTRGIQVSTLTTQEWKANYSKEKIAEKVHAITGEWYDSDHKSDSVGIGLAFKGLL